MASKETITNNLRFLRGKFQVTQQELADAVDVSRQTIISMEKGSYVPSVLLAIKIAKYFNIRVEDIFIITT